MFPAIIINLLIVVILVFLALYLVRQIPDANLQKIFTVVIVVLACIWLIYALSGMAWPGPVWRRP